MTQEQLAIKAALTRSLEILGADPILLGWLGSWGDCATEKEVAQGIREWNHAHEEAWLHLDS